MKILVTGGAGYVGSHACKALTEKGHEILVYDNLSTGHRTFVRWGGFAHGDIRDTAYLRRCLEAFRPDGVMHFAASAYVGESMADPGKYYRNNAEGSLSLLEAMRDAGVRLIVVSGSCAVYGQPDILPVDESCPLAPLSPYGASKMIMERMLADFDLAHGIRGVSLRYFNAAGASPAADIGELHEPETHLIPRVILAALGKMPCVAVFGGDYPTPDGTCVRDYVHVCDLADAHVRALEYLAGGGASAAFNLGSGKGASVLEIVRGVEENTGFKVPLRMEPRRPGDPARLVADADKARSVLGWRPARPLRVILADAVRFHTAVS